MVHIRQLSRLKLRRSCCSGKHIVYYRGLNLRPLYQKNDFNFAANMHTKVIRIKITVRTCTSQNSLDLTHNQSINQSCLFPNNNLLLLTVFQL